MKLPPPEIKGMITVEQAIAQRRTVRRFAQQRLEPEQLSQILWAANGITDPRRFLRAAPSAGALYPMDLYVVAGHDGVRNLEAGVYHHQPKDHTMSAVVTGDRREAVARASLSQMWMARAPVSIVITAEYSRVTGKYGNRGVRYALIEAGHVGQNIYLQAEAMALRVGIVGAFDDSRLIEVMNLPPSHEPLSIMPVGYPKQ